MDLGNIFLDKDYLFFGVLRLNREYYVKKKKKVWGRLN